jgi:Cft2 family RNA processing exonuclease
MFPETQPHLDHVVQISYARVDALRFPHILATKEARTHLAICCEETLENKGYLMVNPQASRHSPCHKCGNRPTSSLHITKNLNG